MPLLMAAAEMCGDNERGKNCWGSQAEGMKGQTWTLLCIPLSFRFPCRLLMAVLGYKTLRWAGMKAIFVHFLCHWVNFNCK